MAGRIPIGQGGIETPYTQGSLELDLNFAEAGGPADGVVPAPRPPLAKHNA